MNKSRWMRCVKHVADIAEIRNAHKVSVKKPEREKNAWKT
jgi:hypothetical protein